MADADYKRSVKVVTALLDQDCDENHRRMEAGVPYENAKTPEVGAMSTTVCEAMD
jgi:hypothetical protein